MLQAHDLSCWKTLSGNLPTGAKYDTERFSIECGQTKTEPKTANPPTACANRAMNQSEFTGRTFKQGCAPCKQGAHERLRVSYTQIYSPYTLCVRARYTLQCCCSCYCVTRITNSLLVYFVQAKIFKMLRGVFEAAISDSPPKILIPCRQVSIEFILRQCNFITLSVSLGITCLAAGYEQTLYLLSGEHGTMYLIRVEK